MVTLIGAGPGSAGLITVAGLEALRRADVVVYDALADPRLLCQARPDAERIDAGKRARQHTLTQDQTNALLVERASRGLRVVRLKGGDPYLFGRGAEEAAYLAERGIAVEVIPGVTSGIAAPMAAGIPVTHRSIASTVTFVTGHESPDKPESGIDYPALAALARAGGTLCFYMGVGRLASIADALIRSGLEASTPAAAVQWGFTPRQRQVRGTLVELPTRIVEAGVGSPAIVVVGPVAAIREPGLDFFLRRPLHGQRIVVTRARQQASELTALLLGRGAEVLEAPTIAIEPIDGQDLRRVEAALGRIARYPWLVLTSPNAVEALADRLAALDLDSRSLHGVKIAVVGEASARTLRERLSIRADRVSAQTTSESLGREMAAIPEMAGARVLLLRADIAGPELPTLLGAAGARVEDLCIYRTRRPDSLPAEVARALADGQVDWVTFTSSSTAMHLVEMLGPDRASLERCRLASIGPATSRTMRSLGLEPTVEAEAAGVAALAEAIVASCVKGG